MCFEKSSKGQDQTVATIALHSNLWKGEVNFKQVSQMRHILRPLFIFTKITAATWSINKIIPVFIALEEGHFFISSMIFSTLKYNVKWMKLVIVRIEKQKLTNSNNHKHRKANPGHVKS